jgi:hypothetical protein
MADFAPSDRVLTSQWRGLNPLLLAKFHEVEKHPEDGTVSPVAEGVQVWAPIAGEAAIEFTLNWQSPFENTGPENKAPALAAMVQSGYLQPIINQILGFGNTDQQTAAQQSAINQKLREFEGRTGITRLNSTQIFSGMPPVKFPLTLLFRAFKDAYAEVEAPIAQLMDWALPQELSRDGLVVASLKAAAGQGNSLVDVLMPSRAPKLVAMEYKGRTWGPLVIESIAEPITSPITGEGFYAHVQLPITLCSLTAMDAPEMRGIRASVGGNPNFRRPT